ncbi:prolyl oligopeptidase family serine peptidase [Verrucomicrobiaceae bacterium 227]
MLRFLVPLLLIQSSFADHGTTQAWQDKMKALASGNNKLVPNQRIRVAWSTEDHQALFPLEQPGEVRSLDLKTKTITPLERKPASYSPNSIKPGDFFPKTSRGPRPNPKSPDGKWRVKYSEDSLELIPLGEGKARKLEFPLPEGSVWNSEIFWHPDSSRFAATHRTTHPLRKIHYVRSSPKDQLQPTHELHTYDKPGDLRNINQPVIFHLDDRAPLSLDSQLAPDPYALGRFHWHKDGHRLCLEFTERGFGKFRLLEIDADTGTQRIRAAEESDKFVHVFSNTFHHQFQEKDEILWLSERSGYLHLYLIDGKTGETTRQLTDGKWIVRDVIGLDESSRRALIEISGYYPKQDPYYKHYAFLNLDDGQLTLLTDADGTHEIEFSPDRSHYLAKWSRVDHPPVFEIHRTSDGSKVATLNKPDLAPLNATGWQTPEKFVCKDRNDQYDIHGVIFRPQNFDPDKKYPVIENIYAGPHGAFVPKSFSAWHGHKSEMAEGGFIVVQIDGLGTNYRGREFQQVAYKNLKDSGFPDRIKWLQAAAAKYPQMDLSRVGIYGGSAGGQSSTAALLHHGDFYKAAVSDCGCHDNRLDKMWWNEQWLDWPLNDSYLDNANLTHIEKLQGHLMLTVGEMDQNVDPASTLQLVNGLILADKDYEFHLIPNAGHGCGEMPHMRRKRIEFFQKHL